MTQDERVVIFTYKTNDGTMQTVQKPLADWRHATFTPAELPSGRLVEATIQGAQRV